MTEFFATRAQGLTIAVMTFGRYGVLVLVAAYVILVPYFENRKRDRS